MGEVIIRMEGIDKAFAGVPALEQPVNNALVSTSVKIKLKTLFIMYSPYIINFHSYRLSA